MKYKIVETDKKQPTRDIIPLDEFFCSNCNSMVTVDEMVDNDRPEGVLNWLDSHVKCCGNPNYHTFMNTLRHFTVKPDPRGLKVEMVCGDIHKWDTEQPSIKSVTLHGEQIYPSEEPVITGKLLGDNPENIAKLLSRVTGEEWRYDLNASYNRDGSITDMTMVSIKCNDVQAIFPISNGMYLRFRRVKSPQ